jgi:hypothetical protein
MGVHPPFESAMVLSTMLIEKSRPSYRMSPWLTRLISEPSAGRPASPMMRLARSNP